MSSQNLWGSRPQNVVGFPHTLRGLFVVIETNRSHGVIAFAGLAITYIAVMWGRGFPWATYAMISGLLLLISVLFFLSWRQRLRARTAGQQPLGAA